MWLRRCFVLEANDNSNVYTIRDPQGDHGNVVFLASKSVVKISLGERSLETEVKWLSHFFWLLAFCSDAVEEQLARRVVIGATDLNDIQVDDTVDQARHSAAFYPADLLGSEASGYLKIGHFMVSPYATFHLSELTKPISGATAKDAPMVALVNEYVDRKREEARDFFNACADLAKDAIERQRDAPFLGTGPILDEYVSMREEYELNGEGRRGRFAARYAEGTNLAASDADGSRDDLNATR